MIRVLINRFVARYLSDDQAVILLGMIAVGAVAILGFGHMLIPLFAALVLAFMMEGAIDGLQHWGLRRLPALFLVFGLFLSMSVLLLIVVLPLLWDEAVALTNNFPDMLRHSQISLWRLPRKYPHLVSNHDVEGWMHSLQSQMGQVGQWLLALSPNIISHVVSLSIYMVLIPTLVFMLLKDRDTIQFWLRDHLPAHRPDLSRMREAINRQLYRYVRGRMIEMVIVFLATYLMFLVQGLSYALLLAILVGVSVIVPYMGAVVVSVPVMVVAFFEWDGITPHFWRIISLHSVIQLIDGNLIVPLLFAEAVELHPIAIIIAIMIFGGLWGFWGVFFAIPLAVVLRCLLVYWPVRAVDGTK